MKRKKTPAPPPLRCLVRHWDQIISPSLKAAERARKFYIETMRYNPVGGIVPLTDKDGLHPSWKYGFTVYRTEHVAFYCGRQK